MIKRTLYFGNPAYLNLDNQQLIVRLPVVEKNHALPEKFRKEAYASIPIEDIGVVILDHRQLTITQALLDALVQNNVAVVSCDASHMPAGLLLPIEGHNIQHEKYKHQIAASVPLKKQLWQQTVIVKIMNQAAILEKHDREFQKMIYWAKRVRSGDPDNCEGKAAFHYWSNLFDPLLSFSRDRNGAPPNNLLNYGYAILRAIAARSLVGSGLLPTLGIHHCNKYNAYCLADDVMEPYRPFVDELALKIVKSGVDYSEITPEIKKGLLELPVQDVVIEGKRSPLMIAMQMTTASLAGCFDGSRRKIAYPEIK